MVTDFTGAGRDALDHTIGCAPRHLRIPLVATRDHMCRFVFVRQGGARFDVPDDRPAIVLIGDDFSGALGPRGFDEVSLRRYLGRCRAASVVACEPVISAYALPCTNAVLLRQDVIIVETRPDHEADWVNFLSAARPGIAIVLATFDVEGNA